MAQLVQTKVMTVPSKWAEIVECIQNNNWWEVMGRTVISALL